MDLLAPVLGTLLAVALAALAFLGARLRALPERLEAERVTWDQMHRELRRDFDAATARAEAAQADAAAARAREAAAEALLAATRQAAEALVAERDAAVAARESALAERAAAQREAAVAGEAVRNVEAQLKEFEKLKAEFLNVTQAATLEAAQKLSSKLLDDHRRENEAAKQASEARVKLSTEALTSRVEQITTLLGQLQGKVEADSKSLNTMLRALSHPGGAGQHAEDILANTLRMFDLEDGRDYVLQFATQNHETGARLRPDGIVFLPGDGVLVVDVKASKHLISIAEAEEGDGETAAYAGLARTMHLHLRALAAKDYRSAVVEDCRRSGRSAAGRVWTLMFLSSDAAIAKLRRADPSFFEAAVKHDIMIAGPSVLSCAIQIARSHILSARQLENQARIVEGARALLDGVATVLEHADKVGRGIKSAADHYERFTGSVNRTLLSRARKLDAYGVKGKKALPGPLPAYQVVVADSVIDAEAEEVVEERPLPRLVSREG